MSRAQQNGCSVLVVTDNTYLLSAFQRLAAAYSAYRFHYAHSHNNRGADQLIAMGCKAVHVRQECDAIIQDYDLIFSLHCKQIFPKALVEAVRCINLHPGLNPYNRGWFPQVFSILNGLPAGATLHEMVAEVDRGPVIAQTEVPIHHHDTSLTAYERIQQAEVALLEAWFERLLSGDYTTTETPDGNYNGVEDHRDLCQLDLDREMTLGGAIDLLRALTHPPYRNAYFMDGDGKRVFLSLDLQREDE
jgi:dTDP-4-amino-4,6-dideoxyglucose formyltransferase